MSPLWCLSRAVLYVFSLMAVLCASPALSVAQETELITFEIKDQFKEKHTDGDYPGKPLVTLGSDKDGSKFNRVWAKAIYDSLKAEGDEKKVIVLGVADLRGVPFFIKGFVRGKFPKDKDSPILMDWKGAFAKAYQYEPEHCNVLIFDTEGALVHRVTVTEMDAGELEAILQLLKGLLSGADVD